MATQYNEYKDPTKGETTDKGLSMKETEEERNPNLVYTTDGAVLTDANGNPFESYRPNTIGGILEATDAKDEFLKDMMGTGTSVGGYIDPEFGKSSYDFEARTATDLSDINEVRAREQGTVAKLAGGFGRYVATTGLGTVGNIVGAVVGLGEGLYNAATGEDGNAWSRFWDGYINNSVNEFVHDTLDKVNEWMPNYRSKYEQDMGVFRSIFTAGFLSDQIANLGWTSSAILSTVLTGGLGGASAASGLARVLGASKGAQSFIYRLVGGITGAFAEASTESIDRYHEAKDAYSSQLRQQEQGLQMQMQTEIAQRYAQDGYNPTIARDENYEKLVEQEVSNRHADEINNIQSKYEGIEQNAKAAARQTFLLNEIILGATNTLGVFSNIKAPMVNAERIAKGSITNMFREKGAQIAASKGELAVREGLEMVSEGVEEISQKWAGTTAQAYYGQEYDPKYTGQVKDWMSVAGDKFFETVEDKESWKEFMAGFITGATGAGGAKRVQEKGEDGKMHSKVKFDWVGGIWSMPKDINKTNETSTEIYNQVNEVYNDKNLQRKLRLMTGSLADKDAMLQAAQEGDKNKYLTAANNQMVRTIEAFADLGQLGELRAMIGQNDNISDDELEKFVMANVVEEKDENGKPTGKYQSDLGLVDINGEPLTNTPEGKQKLRERLKKNTQQVLKTIDFYNEAINEADQNTGYQLDRQTLSRFAWGMTQAELADGRAKDIISKNLDILKQGLPSSKSKYSESAIKQINKTIKNLQDELKRENKKPDSEERTNNIKALNQAIEELQGLTKEDVDGRNILEALFDRGNLTLIGSALNSKVDDEHYLADLLLDNLADKGLLTDDVKRDVNDVLKLYRARNNYDQMVNEWAKNPQEVKDLMDREADIIHDQQIRSTAAKLNELYKQAEISSISDFDNKFDNIARKAGVTPENFAEVLRQAGKTNKDLILYGQAYLNEAKLMKDIVEAQNVSDAIKGTAIELLRNNKDLFQRIKYASKEQIIRQLATGFDNLSKEEQELIEQAASLIYSLKEKNNKDNTAETERKAAENESYQPKKDVEESSSPNNSDTPVSDAKANNQNPIQEHENKAILEQEFNSRDDKDHIDLGTAFVTMAQNIDNLKAQMNEVSSDNLSELARIATELMSFYTDSLQFSVKEKAFYELAEKAKNAIKDFYQRVGLPNAFVYDNISKDNAEVKSQLNGGLNTVDINFLSLDEAPDECSIIANITFEAKDGFIKENVTVVRGKQIAGVEAEYNSDTQDVTITPVYEEGEKQEDKKELPEEESSNEGEELSQEDNTKDEKEESENKENKEESTDELVDNSTSTSDLDSQMSFGDKDNIATEENTEEKEETQSIEEVSENVDNATETPEVPTEPTETPEEQKPEEKKEDLVGLGVQDALLWVNGGKYTKKGGKIVKSKIPAHILSLFKENNTFDYVMKGGLTEFMKNNPNAPLYFKDLTNKKHSRIKTSQIGVYVKDGSNYILIGYIERAWSKTRADYSITNNIATAVSNEKPDARLETAHYKDANNNAVYVNIQCTGEKNDDGFFTIKNAEGKYLKLNKVSTLDFMTTERHPLKDTNVGSKSLIDSYNDGEVFVGTTLGNGKPITLYGKNETMETPSSTTIPAGSAIISYKGPNGQFVQSGFLGKKFDVSDIDSLAENSIVKSAIDSLKSLQEIINESDISASSASNIAAFINSKEELGKDFITRDFKVKNTKDGYTISVTRRGEGTINVQVAKDCSFEDLVQAFTNLKLTYQVPQSLEGKFEDFMEVAETSLDNFEQPAIPIISFVDTSIDETKQVRPEHIKEPNVVNFGGIEVRVTVGDNSIKVQPLNSNTIYQRKDKATLLGLKYDKFNVDLIETTANQILLDIVNKFKDKPIITVSDEFGDEKHIVYYPANGSTIETFFDVDANKCIDVSDNTSLKDALEEAMGSNQSNENTTINEIVRRGTSQTVTSNTNTQSLDDFTSYSVDNVHYGSVEKGRTGALKAEKDKDGAIKITVGGKKSNIILNNNDFVIITNPVMDGNRIVSVGITQDEFDDIDKDVDKNEFHAEKIGRTTPLRLSDGTLTESKWVAVGYFGSGLNRREAYVELSPNFNLANAMQRTAKIVNEKYNTAKQKKTNTNNKQQSVAQSNTNNEQKPETINIYAGTNENTDLSNFAERPFTYSIPGYEYFKETGKDTTFKTVEHAFQASKWDSQLSTDNPNNEKIIQRIQEILDAPNAAKAREIGRRKDERLPFDKNKWDKESSNKMKEMLKASFEQNPKAKERLLSTGNAILTHTQDKGKWGTEFPRILMEVREELRATQPQAETPQQPVQKPSETKENEIREAVARSQKTTNHGRGVNMRRGGKPSSKASAPVNMDDDYYAAMADEQDQIFNNAEAGIRDKMQGGNTITLGMLLSNIGKNSQLAALANNLLSKLGELKGLQVRVVPRIEGNAYGENTRVAGLYNPEDNTITISAAECFHSNYAFDATVLHETMHAIVHNTKIDGQKRFEFNKLFREIKDSILKKYGVKSLDELEGTKVYRKLYGLNNPDEFISEIFINSDFAAEIDSVEKSFFDRFVEWLFDLLNLPMSKVAKKQVSDILLDFKGKELSREERKGISIKENDNWIDKAINTAIEKHSFTQSAREFAKKLVKAASESGTIDSLISKIQNINQYENKEDLVDFIKAAYNTINNNELDGFEDSDIVERYYDSEFNNILDTNMKSIQQIFEMFKDPDFVVLIQKESKKENSDSNTQTELNQIKEQSIANGTFMKAPNGKPTNLNEKQWLQVRTKAFKDWFGDWERAYDITHNKGRSGLFRDMENKALTKINPDFPAYNNAINNLALKLGRVPMQNEINPADLLKEAGLTKYIKTINFADDTVGEDVQFDLSEDYAEAQMDLVDLKKKHPNLNLKFHSYNVLNQQGERFIEDFKKQDLSQSIYDDLNVVNSVSKVVDENGEPLVVYHYTDNENLNEFSVDFDNYFAQSGGTKKAIFFTEDKVEKGEEDNFLTQRKARKSVFLNIKDLKTYNGTKEDLHKKGTSYREVVNKSAEENDVDGGVHMSGFDDNKKTNQDIWIIHNPNQVKSATDNVGTFSRENNDIRYSASFDNTNKSNNFASIIKENSNKCK